MPITADTIIGRGVLIPLRRQGGDFVSGGGMDELRSSLRQLLLTQKGEVRWRPDFGIDLDRFRHQNIEDTVLAEVQEEIVSGISKFEPRIEIVNIEIRQVEAGSNMVEVRLQWQAISRTRRRNTALGAPQMLEVTV